MGWFSRKKAPKPAPDYAGAHRRRVQQKLDTAESELAKMEQGLPHIGERLQQGHLGAAAIAARACGFSSAVSRPLEKAQKYREPSGSDEFRYDDVQFYGQDRVQKAKSLTAEAGANACVEHHDKISKAKELRRELEKL